MEVAELLQYITPISEDIEVKAGKQYTEIVVSFEKLHPLMTVLRQTPALQFDYLFNLTAIDFADRMELNYHLQATGSAQTIMVKAVLPNRTEPEIQSVSDLYLGAEFHELEAYDLFGIVFIGHPKLRRIFLTDEWQGFPMRKDYSDDHIVVR